jgi:hypothetical protein
LLVAAIGSGRDSFSPAGRKHPYPTIEAVLFLNNPLKDKS